MHASRSVTCPFCYDPLIYHDFPSYPMTMFEILGILAVLATGMIAIPDISAVRCSEDKNPIQSPSGKTACVFDDTFARLLERGWGVPETNPNYAKFEIPSSPTDIKYDVWNTRDLASPDQDMVLAPVSKDRLFPTIEIEIPKMTPINDTMTLTVRYDYSPRHVFHNSENMTEFNPKNVQNMVSRIPTVHGEFVGPQFIIVHTKHMEMISDYPVIEYGTGYDYYGEGLHTYYVTLPYNGNIPHEAQISFRIKQPMLYNQEIFHLSTIENGLTDYNYEWYLSTNNDKLTISPFPIYAEGLDDSEFPHRGERGKNPDFPPTKPGPDAGPISLDDIDNLPESLQREIRE